MTWSEIVIQVNVYSTLCVLGYNEFTNNNLCQTDAAKNDNSEVCSSLKYVLIRQA